MNFIKKLEIWYEENRRLLPWRETKDPYKIWISEIIFQQTRINQGLNYYINFVEKFPNIQALALASEDEVLKLWQGLGYYSRAHNLHFTAKHIYYNLKGKFPSTYAEILQLKGIGKYTAAAIASVSFDEKVPAIDGNAFRVYSRVFNSDRDISKIKTFNYFFELMKPYMPDNPGNFNQAIMDFGSLVCKPVNPKCNGCPISVNCLAHEHQTQSELPIKKSTIKIKEEKLHYVYITYSKYFLIKKRNVKSIWKGLYEFLLYDKEEFGEFEILHTYTTKHKLTHRILNISISEISIDKDKFYDISTRFNAEIITKNKIEFYAFPKPLEIFLHYN